MRLEATRHLTQLLPLLAHAKEMKGLAIHLTCLHGHCHGVPQKPSLNNDSNCHFGGMVTKRACETSELLLSLGKTLLTEKKLKP